MSVMLQRNDSQRAHEIKERMGRSRRDHEDEKEWSRRKQKLEKMNFKATKWQDLSR